MIVDSRKACALRELANNNNYEILPENEIFSSAQQSVCMKGVKAHEQCQGP